MTKEFEKLIRRSIMARGRSVRAITELLGPATEGSLRILTDEEAVRIKRVAEENYLDFPDALRGYRKDGFLEHGKPIKNSPIDEFLSKPGEELIYIFMEPWVIRGAIIIDINLAREKISNILEFSDYDIKMYGYKMNRSCVIRDNSEEGNIVFSIAT